MKLLCSTAKSKGRCPLCAKTGHDQVRQKSEGSLFDHPIGQQLHRYGNIQSKCLGDHEVDNKFKFGRLHNRQIARFRWCSAQPGATDERLSVISGNRGTRGTFYPRKQKILGAVSMSALRQKQTRSLVRLHHAQRKEFHPWASSV
jgi:hypothetical protein